MPIRVITEVEEMRDLLIESYHRADEFWYPLEVDELSWLVSDDTKGAVFEDDEGAIKAFVFGTRTAFIHEVEVDGEIEIQKIPIAQICTGFHNNDAAALQTLVTAAEQWAASKGFSHVVFYTKLPPETFGFLGYSRHATLLKKAL